MPQRNPQVYYPRDSSLFLNYGVSYVAGDSLRFESLGVTNEAGARWGNFLLYTDTSYTRTNANVDRFVRLMSNVTYDDRPGMTLTVAGDFYATSGDLGSLLNMGGISYSKLYRMDPYLVVHPMLTVTGAVTLPSEADIYLNGMKLRTERLAPGEFQLQNITNYAGEANLEVVVRDPFGREQRLNYPNYFSDILLKQGLHQYSYNAGFLREGFGIASNDYGKAAFSFYHRYGANDRTTIGFRGEGTDKLINLGPQASLLIPNAGVVSITLSGGLASGRGAGGAISLSHIYQGPVWTAQLSGRYFSRDYGTVAGSTSHGTTTRYEAGGGIGYVTPQFGSLSLTATTVSNYTGGDRQTVGVSYSRELGRGISLSSTFRSTFGGETTNEFMIGLNYSPRPDLNLYARHSQGNGYNDQLLQVQSSQPVGEGISYRASLDRFEKDQATVYAINPYVRYNARRGIISAEYLGNHGNGVNQDRYNLNLAGGIVAGGARSACRGR